MLVQIINIFIYDIIMTEWRRTQIRQTTVKIGLVSIIYIKVYNYCYFFKKTFNAIFMDLN